MGFHVRNDLYCVGWGVKLLKHSIKAKFFINFNYKRAQEYNKCVLNILCDLICESSIQDMFT